MHLPCNVLFLTDVVSTGTTVAGAVGLTAIFAAFLKDFWVDRQKSREHRERMLRIRASVRLHREELKQISLWIESAKQVYPNLPEFHSSLETGHRMGQEDDKD